MPRLTIDTERLNLRPLSRADLAEVATLGRDPRVMASLGGVFSSDASEAWLERQLAHWEQHGYGRFRVSCAGSCVGYVGLSRLDFDLGIVPSIEIAWRLAFDAWGKGYATEAARAVIEQAFSQHIASDIIGVTSATNLRSRRVMARLGMQHEPESSFEHPRLRVDDPMRPHVVYRLRAAEPRSSGTADRG